MKWTLRIFKLVYASTASSVQKDKRVNDVSFIDLIPRIWPDVKSQSFPGIPVFPIE